MCVVMMSISMNGSMGIKDCKKERGIEEDRRYCGIVHNMVCMYLSKYHIVCTYRSLRQTDN